MHNGILNAEVTQILGDSNRLQWEHFFPGKGHALCVHTGARKLSYKELALEALGLSVNVGISTILRV